MSKKKTVFTDTMIKKLKPEESDYSRSEGNGFTVTVRTTGTKTWLYLYAINGKRRKMNLGNYPAVTLETARGKFQEAQVKVKNGVDPLAEAEAAKQEHIDAPTMAGLITEYIEKHAKPHKRGWLEDERILHKDALPAWGNRKAKDIKKRDVVLLLEGIVERGAPGSANNNFKIIRKMFRFAVQRDILEHSPCDGVVMPAPLNRGDRVLTEQEIKALWLNLDTCHISDEIRRALKLILLTGQRPGEVIGIHSAEIDGQWWTIPVERSKNKRAHRVYLTDTALDLIGSKTGFIFESPVSGGTKNDGTTKAVKSIAVNAVALTIRRNTAVPVTDDKGNPLFDADGKPAVRRTAATFMSQLGMLDEVIDAVLNHTKQGIIRTYNLNRYDREKQQALESWERKLQAIITNKGKDNVVSIGTAKSIKAA
jgi:integrase